jgi:hypothetical protein
VGTAATNYDPKVIERFAEQLLSKAGSVRIYAAATGGVVGLIVGAVPLTPLQSVWRIPAHFGIATLLVGAVIGALIGFVLGEGRAFRYRVQAQMALFQLDIERKVEAAVRGRSEPVAAQAPPAPAAPPRPAQAAPRQAAAAPAAPAPARVPVAAPAAAAPAPASAPVPAAAPAPAAPLPPPLPPLLREPPAGGTTIGLPPLAPISAELPPLSPPDSVAL